MTDYASILNSQREFFLSGQTRDTKFRKQMLCRLRDTLKANEERLYKAVYDDFRKSRFDTFSTEFAMIYSEIEYFLKHLDRLNRPARCTVNMANLPARLRLVREPLGCMLIIGAWNYPYQLTLLPAVDAIAAGNTCILKPSELTSNAMRLTTEIINDSFPAEYLHAVEGGSNEATELLKLKYDKIFFTGSPRVGKIVYEAAAKNMTPVTLELGGKSPVIVTRSADLKVAARRIVWGKYLNAGQTCVAPDYLIVEQSIEDEFLALLKLQIDKFRYTDGSQNYTSIINERHFDRITALIDPSKVYCGGSSNPQTRYIEPTVIRGITWDDASMQEEIFGPVLPVMTFTSLQDTIYSLSRMEKPLAAYLFSRKDSEQRLFTESLSFGGGCINDVIMHLTGSNAPFGGIGNSGIGHYHGEYGLDDFSHRKTMLIKPFWGETNVKYPPYDDKKLRWIKKLL